MQVWIGTTGGVGAGLEMDIYRLLDRIDFWGPLMVHTEKERDYLLGMQLMVGKEFTVLLKGVDIPKTITDTICTHVRIPGLSQGEQE